MDKQTKVILKEIEKINQEILILSQRVKKLEKNLKLEQIKIKPNNTMNTNNLDAIIESANIAMNRFNKRINRES
jgi:NAD dependent epimerase/dehydratase family enzyme